MGARHAHFEKSFHDDELQIEVKPIKWQVINNQSEQTRFESVAVEKEMIFNRKLLEMEHELGKHCF